MKPVTGTCPRCNATVDLIEVGGVWVTDEHLDERTGQDCLGIYAEPTSLPLVPPDPLRDDPDDTPLFVPT